MRNSRLVYSTETGRICPKCQMPVTECTCKKKRSPKPQTDIKRDGVIQLRREVKGRNGKTVTVIAGFNLNDNDLKDLAKQLKRHCGTGGSAKDGIIIIQGDHREVIRDVLKDEGYNVKFAGG